MREVSLHLELHDLEDSAQSSLVEHKDFALMLLGDNENGMLDDEFLSLES